MSQWDHLGAANQAGACTPDKTLTTTTTSQQFVAKFAPDKDGNWTYGAISVDRDAWPAYKAMWLAPHPQTSELIADSEFIAKDGTTHRFHISDQANSHAGNGEVVVDPARGIRDFYNEATVSPTQIFAHEIGHLKHEIQDRTKFVRDLNDTQSCDPRDSNSEEARTRMGPEKRETPIEQLARTSHVANVTYSVKSVTDAPQVCQTAEFEIRLGPNGTGPLKGPGLDVGGTFDRIESKDGVLTVYRQAGGQAQAMSWNETVRQAETDPGRSSPLTEAVQKLRLHHGDHFAMNMTRDGTLTLKNFDQGVQITVPPDGRIQEASMDFSAERSHSR